MNNARLLIVEDEAIVATDLQKQLSKLGYKVEGRAKSGEEAVRLARQFSPDLVLMDVRLMGPMDGLEAAKLIHRETGIPIVYMTAYANLIMNDPHQMQPPHLCVAKPFSLSHLHQVIEIALEQNAPPGTRSHLN
jgi:CheY-like chemotaxis protein